MCCQWSWLCVMKSLSLVSWSCWLLENFTNISWSRALLNYLISDFVKFIWQSTYFPPFLPVFNLAGKVHGGLSTAICYHVSQLNHIAVTSNMGNIIAYGWTPCTGVLCNIMFEHHSNVDIFYLLTSCGSICSALYMSIFGSICCKPMVNYWLIWFTCTAWSIYWSAYWIYLIFFWWKNDL